MTEEIKYIVYPEEGKKNKSSFDYDRTLNQIEKKIKNTLSRTGGILKLESFSNGFSGQTAYYIEPINGIICDLDEASALAGHISSGLFPDFDRYRSLSICHLVKECGVMTSDEYKILRPLCLKNGWDHVLDGLAIVTIDPIQVKRTDSGTESGMLYGIPVFRCEQGEKNNLAEYFIQHSFWPMADHMQADREILRQILHYQESGGNLPIQPRHADESKLNAIKNHYLQKGVYTAMLKEYPPDIFQIQNGSWDLYRFVHYSKEDLRAGEGQWYEVSGMYARNPLDDVATDIDYIAIDFGTKSTVVAAFDSQSNINLIPIGTGAENMEKQYENPTIMRFVNVRQFLDNYRHKEYRPDTKFNDVSVSHSALNQFEGTASDPGLQEKMQQYLNQLKQWANNPNRKIQIVDGQGGRFRLGLNGQESDIIDPIEFYAYYIGLSINNMHQGKIYLKYYLSYSATYSKSSRQQILASFKKGLRKSLPEELKDLPGGLENRFEVKLWHDEATAYAVCALNSYENHFRSLGDKGKSYLTDMKNGLFYSVYDFGGGTLDISFGIMNSFRDYKKYTLLQSGGASYLGCEYILEELAFQIFFENRATLNALDIRCCRPSRFDQMQDDGGILADTSQARFNTNVLISFLRKQWIGTEEKSNEFIKEFKFYTTSNEEKHLKINSGSVSELPEEPLRLPDIPSPDEPALIIEEGVIENYFEKQVTKGIQIFYSYWKELTARKELEDNTQYHLSQKKCHIFLAGNASKAPRVQACFEKYLTDRGEADFFKIHSPLPTEWDEKQKREHPGIAVPQAKSGVVHGLLMARPTAENIVIENEFQEANFYYHIGSRIYQEGSDPVKGSFHLQLRKSQIPMAESGKFRRLRKITQSMFELLYTSDDSYAIESSEQAVSAGIMAMVITVPEEYKGQYLYICAKENSDDFAELGVSPEDKKEVVRGAVHVIGTCNFPKAKFSKNETDGKIQPLTSARQNRSSDCQLLGGDEPGERISVQQNISCDYQLSGGDMPGERISAQQNISHDYQLPGGDMPGEISMQQGISYDLSILGSGWRANTSELAGESQNLKPIWATEADQFIFCYQKKGMPDTQCQISVPLKAPGVKEIFVLEMKPEFEVILAYSTGVTRDVEVYRIDLKSGHYKLID